MSDKRQPGILGSLPRTRPHRRSDKRPHAVASAANREPVDAVTKPRAASKPKAPAAPKSKPAAPKPAAPKPAATKPKPKAAATPRSRPAAPTPKAATPPKPRAPEPEPQRSPTPGAMQTAVQAAAELAEIGLQASTRALRRTLSRLPRP